MPKTPGEILRDALSKRLVVDPEMVDEIDFKISRRIRADPICHITFQLRVPHEVWQECLREAHPEEAIVDG